MRDVHVHVGGSGGKCEREVVLQAEPGAADCPPARDGGIEFGRQRERERESKMRESNERTPTHDYIVFIRYAFQKHTERKREKK